MKPFFHRRLAYAGAVAWLVLTVALAVWWLVFGIGQARQLESAGAGATPAGRVERMLVWEGVVFIGLLLSGGVLLILAIHRESARRAAVEAFFMAFTHDLKTSLASLRLQADSLKEDLPGADGNANLDRLMKDAVRLQLQLENSLYYAQREGQLYVESISMADLVRRVAVDWPELEVQVAGDARVRADERALVAVLRNVLQNAVVHGGARSVSVQIERSAAGQVTTTLADDGRGAPPDVIRSLGRPLARAAAFHGSGVGLLISQHLLGRMRGAARFGAAARRGLTVTIDLPEAG